MTQAELDFYTGATRALKGIANEVHTLNENIQQLIENQQAP